MFVLKCRSLFFSQTSIFIGYTHLQGWKMSILAFSENRLKLPQLRLKVPQLFFGQITIFPYYRYLQGLKNGFSGSVLKCRSFPCNSLIIRVLFSSFNIIYINILARKRERGRTHARGAYPCEDEGLHGFRQESERLQRSDGRGIRQLKDFPSNPEKR